MNGVIKIWRDTGTDNGTVAGCCCQGRPPRHAIECHLRVSQTFLLHHIAFVDFIFRPYGGTLGRLKISDIVANPDPKT